MANNIDILLGKALTEIRIASKTTIAELAHALKTSKKDIEAYENGDKRISAENLQKISEYLERPVRDFFQYVDQIRNQENLDKITRTVLAEASKALHLYQYEQTDTKKALELMRHFLSLGEEEQNTLINLASALSLQQKYTGMFMD